MKTGFTIGLLIICLFCVSCFGTSGDKAIEATAAAHKTIRAELGPTAVFQTAVAQKLTENAPPPSSTPTMTLIPSITPTITLTHTSSPTITPEYTETPEIEPTSENPWVLQASCDDNPNCSYLDATNKTPGWLQITITKVDTGESGFFSIRSQGTGRIHYLDGEYWGTFTWWCSGVPRTQRRYLPSNTNWLMNVKCPSEYIHFNNVPN